MRSLNVALAALVITTLLLPSIAQAQKIPPGTVLPVMLSNSLSSEKSKPGQPVSGKIMDRVPLPSGQDIPQGAKILGHVVESSGPDRGDGSRLSIVFDRVMVNGNPVPVSVKVRALATMMAVFEAQVPIFEEDRVPVSAWMLAQVGADAAFRPDNPEKSYRKFVHFSGEPAPGCGTRIDAEGGTGALWVFSPYACGAYGFGRTLVILNDGSTDPLGRIDLISPRRVIIEGGSGWLLRVVASEAPLSGELAHSD